jgi:hypothetical protein
MVWPEAIRVVHDGITHQKKRIKIRGRKRQRIEEGKS